MDYTDSKEPVDENPSLSDDENFLEEDLVLVEEIDLGNGSTGQKKTKIKCFIQEV